jgi:hypothetical protein
LFLNPACFNKYAGFFIISVFLFYCFSGGEVQAVSKLYSRAGRLPSASVLLTVSAAGLGLPRPYAALRRVRAASCSSTTSSRPWREYHYLDISCPVIFLFSKRQYADIVVFTAAKQLSAVVALRRRGVPRMRMQGQGNSRAQQKGRNSDAMRFPHQTFNFLLFFFISEYWNEAP